MMLDRLFQFSLNQQVLTSTSSTNAVDLSQALRSVAANHQLCVDINVTESFAVANPATDRRAVNFAIALSTTGDGTAPVTLLCASSNHYNVGAEAVAPGSGVPAGPILQEGDHVYLPVPPLSTSQMRYLRSFRNGVPILGALPLRFMSLLYTVTTEAGNGLTAGRVTAELCMMPRSEVGVAQMLDAVN